MKLFAVLALAACGGTAKPAAPGPSVPPYLALFERGRAWSLPLVAVNGEHRGEAWVAKGTERGTLRCDIAEVKAVGDANVSHVQCAPPYSGLLVVGWWVATPAGLYHPALPIDDADELSLLGDEDLLLSAKPKEREHSAASSGMQHAIEAFSNGASWCARDTTSAGEERRHFALCIGAAGVTGGGELVVSAADHSWRRTTFGALPEDPDDPTTGQSD